MGLFASFVGIGLGNVRITLLVGLGTCSSRSRNSIVFTLVLSMRPFAFTKQIFRTVPAKNMSCSLLSIHGSPQQLSSFSSSYNTTVLVNRRGWHLKKLHFQKANARRTYEFKCRQA